MSAIVDTFRRQPWTLWWIQAKRISRIEVRRNLLTWRAAWIYFLAFVPTAIILIHFLFDRHLQFALADDTDILAAIVQFYYIRLGIFFGCLGIFSRLIRGEMVERSLLERSGRGHVKLCNTKLTPDQEDSSPPFAVTRRAAGRFVLVMGPSTP